MRLSLLGLLVGCTSMIAHGELVAINSATLWGGTLSAAVRYTESDGDAGATGVWTGSVTAGTKHADTCASWGDATSGALGRVGLANATAATWINQSSVTCDTSYRLYCLSQ